MMAHVCMCAFMSYWGLNSTRVDSLFLLYSYALVFANAWIMRQRE